MDAGGHPQPSPENPMDFTPPRQADGDDAAERPCSGPLKSPQKRLMQEMAHAEDTTPRRRSTRLARVSTPVRLLNLRITVPQVEEAVEESDPGNDTAEINQDVEDEPSQVLAERVLSAVSNPSPPPDFLSFPDIRVNTPPPPEPPESQTQSDNTSAVATPPNPLTGSSLNDEGVENALADSVNRAPTPHTLGFSPRPPGSPQQFALAVGKPLVTESSAGDTLDLPSLASAVISPVNPLIRLQTGQVEHAVAALEKRGDEVTIDDETRDQVAELPTLGESPAKLAGRRRSVRRSASPTKRRSASPDGNRLQPSPRRSARFNVSPRRTPSPDPTLVLPQIFPLRLPAKNSRIRPNPSEVGALSTVDGINERLREAEMEETQERVGRKRKRQDDANKAVGRQRLGSLSPDSQSVLQQLLPPSRSSSDEDDKAKAATSQQSLFGPQRILVNKPPKLVESTHIQTTDPQPHLGTPLRRVLISTSTASQDGTSARRFGETLFKVQPLGDPNRSPSRRVPAMTHPPSSAKSAFMQPTVFSRQPSTSGSSSTLSPDSKPITKQRSMSEEPTFSRQPSPGTNHRITLPYPLTQKPSIIPEEPEDTQPQVPPNGRASSEPPTSAFTSASRSTLRAPTNLSRIPRIGAKPYSRPPGVQPSRLPVLAPRKRTDPSPTKPWTQRGSTGSTLPAEPKHGSFIPTSSRKTAGSSVEVSSKHPVKRPLPTKRLPQLPAVAEKPPPSQIPIRSPPPPQPLALPNLQPSTDSVTQTQPTKPKQEQTDTPNQSSVPPENQLTSENLSIPARLRPRDTSKEEEDTSTARRTRSRRGPSALLEEATFGAISLSPSRPPPKKRPPLDSSGFAGLSITALKNLTTDNTAKNQKVVSLLETEVVKREGNRPESPAVKLRTITEKASEEKAKQRDERAQRRAKRSDGGEVDLPDANELPLEEDGRHRRGAGEEEDYETPERPTRPLRRLKADGSEGVEMVMVKERRVQWDRLLFTTVFIDEIPEKSPRPPEQKLGKGCLSQAAKVFCLLALATHRDPPPS
ncbi:hypothetical protein BDM02DRAFT_2137103 [Thelephora ganbajun]|uniref:Uncharacterized protein n=1 Tax=Thelephora ganbajun TaxID=370292 RepID=A0ACB6ZU98_THEGA|nr:hypothetical protein BDM02DRAFT_2137103 [Thelephora ganbajun]